MKKFNNLIVSIPQDKLLHYIAGQIVAGLIFIASAAFFPLWITVILSMIVTVVIGILKEVYDKHHPDTHTADFKDAMATIIGGTVTTLFSVILLLI